MLNRLANPHEKYLKLRIHHLSEYVIELNTNENHEPLCIEVEFVTENFSDTSDSKKQKVKHIDRIFIIRGKDDCSCERTVEYITPAWVSTHTNTHYFNIDQFLHYFSGLLDGIDSVLMVNRKLQELKVRKKGMGYIDMETKRQFKRDAKVLESQRSTLKGDIKDMLKALYLEPPVANILMTV